MLVKLCNLILSFLNSLTINQTDEILQSDTRWLFTVAILLGSESGDVMSSALSVWAKSLSANTQ